MSEGFLQYQKLISYSQMFPFKEFDYWRAIKRLPSKESLLVIAYILRMRNQRTIDESNYQIFIESLFRYTTRMQHILLDWLRTIHIQEYEYVDEMSLLMLMDDILHYYNDKERKLSRKDCDDLFLCYLKCCDRRLSLAKRIPKDDDEPHEWIRKFLPTAVYENNLCAIRDYRLGLIKGYELLFKFSYNDHKFHDWLTKFLNARKISSVNEYLYNIVCLFLESSMANQMHGTPFIFIDRRNEILRQFLDNMSIDTENLETNDNGMNYLRDKPLLRYREGAYVMLYTRFFLDKLYSGIVFDIARENVATDGTFAKVYGSMKQYLGQHFTEHYLFYETLRRCFPSTLYKLYSGEELHSLLYEGEPDFIIVRGNKIIIFEFKDVLMRSDVATSLNYDKIAEEISRLFIEEKRHNGKVKAKGITQLANVIGTKLSSIISLLNMDPSTSLEIYPVLVYTDKVFDVEGPSYLLAEKFQEFEQVKEHPSNIDIKDLVMVNLDNLMLLENYLSSKQLVIDNIIDDYISDEKLQGQRRIYPFNKYVVNAAQKMGFHNEKTKWFDDIMEALKIQSMNPVHLRV